MLGNWRETSRFPGDPRSGSLSRILYVRAGHVTWPRSKQEDGTKHRLSWRREEEGGGGERDRLGCGRAARKVKALTPPCPPTQNSESPTDQTCPHPVMVGREITRNSWVNTTSHSKTGLRHIMLFQKAFFF